MSKVLSVSVAAYNVDQFIKQNMESFLGTSVSSKIEVLIVDDGSKDNTAAIVREYEKKYPETIKLIQQKNAGPGATVNTGIKNATGKYFRMVDGDDWVNSQDLEKYIHFLENNDVDVVYTDYYQVDNKSGKKVLEHLVFDKKNQVLNYDEVCNLFDVEMHNVTYKTSILQDNSIILDNCFYTDTEYLLLPVKYLKSIAILDCIIYMYRVSLETQSVNINSMLRNKEMHKLVLRNLIEDFNNSTNKGLLSEQKLNFISKRLIKMIGTHLSIILAQKPTKITKKEYEDFEIFLKNSSYDLYEKSLSLKTLKVLKYSHNLAFSYISKRLRKKLNLND